MSLESELGEGPLKQKEGEEGEQERDLTWRLSHKGGPEGKLSLRAVPICDKGAMLCAPYPRPAALVGKGGEHKFSGTSSPL